MEMIVTVTQVHLWHSLYSWSVTQLTTLSSYSSRVSLTQCWRYWFFSCHRRLERELELESTLFLPCGWIISGWVWFRRSYGWLSSVSQSRTKEPPIWGSVTKRYLWRQNRDDKPVRSLVDLAPVVQKVDSAIHWINHYPLDSAIGCRNT